MKLAETYFGRRFILLDWFLSFLCLFVFLVAFEVFWRQALEQAERFKPRCHKKFNCGSIWLANTDTEHYYFSTCDKSTYLNN